MNRYGFLVLVFGLILLPRLVVAEGTRSIVAVFGVEAKGVEMDAGLLDRLSDYIANRIAGSGQYQVIPRDQIRERLIEQKVESYKACYDQTCQIEVGKELAADRSLATSVMKLGSKCTVTMTLFDLRKAAAEKAASDHGKCSEDDIVATIDKTIDKLLAGRGEPVADLPLTGDAARARELEMKNMTEWIALYAQTGGDTREFFLFGGAAQFFTYKWDWFTLSLIEGGLGGFTIAGSLYGYAGPSLGLRIPFGETGAYELVIGSGAGLGGGYEDISAADADDISAFGLAAFPSIRYSHRVYGTFAMVFKFTVMIPLVNFLDTNFKTGDMIIMLGSIGFSWSS